ncbi:NAD(P)-dependent oxidoreductase [Caballeronia sp. LZ065]|uniref:NAD-dependent epimerase/dehydratase family protein n=1 Tax=Caballeronia sp. LZ065 TaxID=3038571 RepID=UPI00285F172E|nr:NAD(P)-dependent oxidoreductase [Caballeronia sp. LZ065]MDR5784522.1 NAD(P)-dependent oxidoreductase [Caballeronia sp. LZ065]
MGSAQQSLVIGGQGFLGAAIVRHLIARGDAVTIADRYADTAKCDALFGEGAAKVVRADIMDAQAMRDLTQGRDTVYHLAGKLGTTELDDDVLAGIQINITGAVNVFAACVQNAVPNLFYPSKPNVWLNTYTITKHASEQFAKLYASMGSTNISTLRYFNAYGPGQATGPVRKIIPSFAERASKGMPIEIFGSGEQIVDMIHSDDIGRLTVDFVEAGGSADPVDLGRGIGLSVNEIAAAVNDYFGNGAGVVHLPMRRGETPETRLIADIQPLRTVLGDLRFLDWTESLHDTLEWYARAFAQPQAA